MIDDANAERFWDNFIEFLDEEQKLDKTGEATHVNLIGSVKKYREWFLKANSTERLQDKAMKAYLAEFQEKLKKDEEVWARHMPNS